MTFQPVKTFNDLPLLPTDRTVLETMVVCKKLAISRAVLSELTGICTIEVHTYCNMHNNKLFLCDALKVTDKIKWHEIS